MEVVSERRRRATEAELRQRRQDKTRKGKERKGKERKGTEEGGAAVAGIGPRSYFMTQLTSSVQKGPEREKGAAEEVRPSVFV